MPMMMVATSRSSGPPVLQAIEGAGLTNTVIVVTRYFGGTKMGIGGTDQGLWRYSPAGYRRSRPAKIKFIL